MSNIDVFNYNRNSQVFHACNAAGVILTVAGTVVTGLTISNPFGSGKKIALISANFVPTTVPAATYTCGLAVGFSTTAVTLTTPVSAYSSEGVGVGSAAKARICSSATFPSAVVLARTAGYAPTTPATSVVSWKDQIDGEIILVPGAYAVVAVVGTAPTGITSYSWVEIDE